MLRLYSWGERQAFRWKMRVADRLLKRAGRGRLLWPWLAWYLWLLDVEAWCRSRVLLANVKGGDNGSTS